MDLEYYANNPLDMNDVIGTDLSEIVDSICQDGILQQEASPERFPDSPPDSGSEHLLSPVNPGSVYNNPDNPEYYKFTSTNMLPDLSKVNYTVPMQMIDEVMVQQQGSVQVYTENGKRRQSCEEASNSPLKALKTELPLSPDNLNENSVYNFPNSIRFNPFFKESWVKMATARLVEMKAPGMSITADKGFNFSAQDDAFIVQKKNHFQVTCDIQMEASPRFIKRSDGTLQEISYMQVNFYGVKSDIPTTQIKIEQSQADRSKKEFIPVRLDLNQSGSCYQVTVGRLHFAETTSNNMRKKGKPNPAQKYFQLVVSLEAVVVGLNNKKSHFEVARLASEKVIVRASNPGQFESDNEPPWTRDMSSDAIFHMGRVAINTEQGSEALTVHGNIQISGQVMQPSDARIKTVLRQVNPKDQLENVNKINIVQYKYKPEFLRQLPEEERHRLENVSHTGIIAQDIRKVIPDAVSSSGPYVLSNGKEIDDMLIVNKDRLFLENLGAVRELSKVTGHLGLRVDDLEKANETVAVKLSNLRRGASVRSTTSSLNSSQDFKQKKTKTARTLFQNRCIQLVLLTLIAIIAVSLVSIATVYIIDYHGRVQIQDSFLNATTKIDLTTTTSKEDFTFFTTTTRSTAKWSSTTTTPFSMPSENAPVLGFLGNACDQSNSDKCQFYCCLHPNRSNEEYVINNVFLVEPEEKISSTTVTSTISSDMKKNLIDLLSSEILESAKENQVIDDVTKPTDVKEDKLDLKVSSSTEKTNGIKTKTSTTSKSLKKEENEVDIGGEHMNEVFDYEESEALKSNNDSVQLNTTDDEDFQPQRAKRDINFGDIREQLGHLVTGLVRRIRDTGHSLVLEKKSSKPQLFITGPNAGNVSLDYRYCDRSSPQNQLHDCFQNTGFNTSYEIPISRHFGDPFVNLVFSNLESNYIVMCPIDSGNLYNCEDSHLDPDLSAVTESTSEPGSYKVHVGLLSSIQVKFRAIKRFVRDPAHARRNLCSLSDNKLGALFEEYNLRFYRLCHV